MEIKKAFSYLLVSSSLFTRLIPHPPGCTSVNSSIIYGNSAHSHWINMIIPILFIVLGDILIHFIYYNTPIFSLNSIFTYFSYLLVTVLSVSLRHKRNLFKVCFLTIFSSFLFFVITNFGVYLINGGNLIKVYINGLPFYGWEFLGNVVYTALFFTIHNLFLKNDNAAVMTKESIDKEDLSISTISNNTSTKLIEESQNCCFENSN